MDVARMTDLSNLTAEELLRFGRSYQELISDSWWDEISVRLERLEKCEAALKPFKHYIETRLEVLGDSQRAYDGWLIDDGRHCAQLLRGDWDAVIAALEGK